jgi:hypothetical protein
VAPVWDRSGDLQSGYLFRVFEFRTLNFILYYYFHIFSILVLFVISCHSCRYFLKRAWNNITSIYINSIIMHLKYSICIWVQSRKEDQILRLDLNLYWVILNYSRFHDGCGIQVHRYRTIFGWESARCSPTWYQRCFAASAQWGG